MISIWLLLILLQPVGIHGFDPSPDPTILNFNAIRGVDDLNNMEQVTLDSPVAGTYTITLNGFCYSTRTSEILCSL